MVFQKGQIAWNKGIKGLYYHSVEAKQKIGEASKIRIYSDATKLKMSESHKSENISDEYREKLSESKKGEKNPNFGKELSEENKKKLLEKNIGNTYCLGNKLSDETKRKVGDAERGEKNSNWKGGITPVNMAIRQSTEFNTWHKTVFERDDYTCQLCNTRGGILHAHHIKLFKDYPELRFEISNGITYCKDCHKSIHKKTKILLEV